MATNIDTEKLLLVEGRDEVNFFTAFLKHTGIEDIQIIPVGGKDKFKVELPTLLNAPVSHKLNPMVLSGMRI